MGVENWSIPFVALTLLAQTHASKMPCKADWPVDAVFMRENSARINAVKLGQNFAIVFPLQLGWGGRWTFHLNETNSLKFLGEKVGESSSVNSDGKNEYQCFFFEVMRIGVTEIDFMEKRTFIPDEPARNTAKFTFAIDEL
jgi:hypothetical protein